MSAGRKIKVLQLIKGLDIGGVNGGAERFSIDLARSLPAEQYDVSICAFFKQGTPTEQRWLDQIKQDGIEVFFASNWAGNNNFRSYLQGISQLQIFLRGNPYDICHSHFQLGTIAALYLKLTGSVRHAMRTAHIAFEWEKGWYGWLRQQMFSRWIFPIFLDAEVGVSQAIVDGLQQYPVVKLSRHQPILIYNAIPLDKTIPTDGLLDQEKLGQPTQNKERWIIGIIGRLAEQKGHTYLLEAVKESLFAVSNLECWIIGDGELRPQLEEKAAQLSVGSHVRFLGKQNDVFNLLRQMDLFVLPSLWEGLPTVLMESMACKIPILATDIPGTREIVTDHVTGWLVPPKDPHRLSESMIALLNNAEERSRLARSAYQSLERFSMSRISGQYQALFRAMIRSGNDLGK